MSTSPKIAVVCMIPDRGHVEPLLRLAAIVAQETDAAVTAFLPAEAAWLARHQGFDVVPLDVAAPATKTLTMQALSRRSIFYNAYSNFFELQAAYWTPLRDAASRELARIARELAALAPAAILCDSHVFPDWYERLASSCGAPLVVSWTAGVRHNGPREFVQVFGHSRAPALVQSLVEKAGLLSRYWFKVWHEIVQHRARAVIRTTRRAADERAREALNGRPCTAVTTFTIHSGIGALESLTGAPPPPEPRQFEALLTSGMLRGDPLPSDLAAWFARQERPVVYVSFGTMVQLDDRSVVELLGGLKDARVAVLWSLPGPQAKAIAPPAHADWLRVEETVPQTAVLADDRVRCFVTHAGSSSLLETIVLGKPALCIPFFWDQPYNASLLERLGAGIALPKRRIERARVTHDVARLVSDPAFADRCRRLGSQIEDPERTAPVRRLARELLAGDEVHAW